MEAACKCKSVILFWNLHKNDPVTFTSCNLNYLHAHLLIRSLKFVLLILLVLFLWHNSVLVRRTTLVIFCVLLFAPIVERFPSSHTSHVFLFLAQVKRGNPRVAGNTKRLCQVIKNTRIYGAVPDLNFAVLVELLSRGLRRLRDFGRERVADGALVRVILNDPQSITAKNSVNKGVIINFFHVH